MPGKSIFRSPDSVEVDTVACQLPSMPAPNPIHVIGTILAPTTGRTYRTVLPNGKEIIAHLSRRNAEALGPLLPLTRVHLEMTSYDFSIARISRPVTDNVPAQP